MPSRKPARVSPSLSPGPSARTAGASRRSRASLGATVEIRELPGAVEFAVHVRPRAHRDQAGGSHNGALNIRVRVPPVEGQANRAVCRLLANALGVPASAVQLISGARSRQKRIRIEGPVQRLAARVSALASVPEN